MEKSRQIVLNQICTPDGTILKSLHRHDYRTHVDKNGKEYMVDGGTDYLRRNQHNDAPHTEMTIYADDSFEVIRESLHRGGRGKNFDQPLTYVPLSKMSNDWLVNLLEYQKDFGHENHWTTHFYKKELEYRKEKDIFIED